MLDLLIKSTVMQISGVVGPIVALVVAIGIAGAAIIIVSSKKNN